MLKRSTAVDDLKVLFLDILNTVNPSYKFVCLRKFSLIILTLGIRLN